MNFRLILSNILFTGALILIGGFLGVVGGVFLYKLFLPPWQVIDIHSTRADVIDILFVDYRDDTDNPVNDVLYVETQSGDIYSILHDEWSLLPPLPDEKSILGIRRRDGNLIAITTQNKAFELINNKWEELENSNDLWGYEPQQCANWRIRLSFRKVMDSSGFAFAHALADSTKCYVLFGDGSLEVWTRTQDVFSLLGTLGFSATLGIIIVIRIGTKIRRSRNKSKVNHS